MTATPVVGYIDALMDRAPAIAPAVRSALGWLAERGFVGLGSEEQVAALRELEADPTLGPVFLSVLEMTLEAYYRDPAVEAVVEALDGLQLAAADGRHAAAAVRSRAAGPRARPASPPPLRVTQVADVLVVGGGAAGVALAWRLSQHGADVLVLEQGDWVPDDDIPKRHADWQVRARRYWSPSAARRGWPADYPVRNLGANPVDAFVYSAVGGSATGWGGAFWRLLPSDFRGATLDGFGRDWPIGYEDLERYYEINEAEMGMSGIAGDRHRRRRPRRRCRPSPWVRWASAGSTASSGSAGTGGCSIRRSRRATTGAGRRARTTGTARTAARPARWRRPRTRTGPRRCATACGCRRRAGPGEITLDTRGRADGVLYNAPDGSVQRATAPVVVLACNGLGTPRLLLMSSSPAFPDGLANSSGMVGRNLMVHVQTTVIGRFPECTGADHGPWGATATTRHFYETDPSRDFKRGFIITAMRGFDPLDTALQTAGWGEGHHAALEHHLNHEAVVLGLRRRRARAAQPRRARPRARRRVRAAWRRDALHAVGELAPYRRGRDREGDGALLRGGRGLRAGARVRHAAGLAPAGHGPHGHRTQTISVVDAWHRCHDVPSRSSSTGR